MNEKIAKENKGSLSEDVSPESKALEDILFGLFFQWANTLNSAA